MLTGAHVTAHRIILEHLGGFVVCFLHQTQWCWMVASQFQTRFICSHDLFSHFYCKFYYACCLVHKKKRMGAYGSIWEHMEPLSYIRLKGAGWLHPSFKPVLYAPMIYFRIFTANFPLHANGCTCNCSSDHFGASGRICSLFSTSDSMVLDGCIPVSNPFYMLP